MAATSGHKTLEELVTAKFEQKINFQLYRKSLTRQSIFFKPSATKTLIYHVLHLRLIVQSLLALTSDDYL